MSLPTDPNNVHDRFNILRRLNNFLNSNLSTDENSRYFVRIHLKITEHIYWKSLMAIDLNNYVISLL